MITRYHGTNISSTDPNHLVAFYNEVLGIPILYKDEGESYDGTELGFVKGSPVIIIWDEKLWGKSSTGKVNFVFNCDDLDATYEELKLKGVHLNPPVTAVWGGKELTVIDPDGNIILLL